MRRRDAEAQALALLIRKFPRLRPRRERSSHRPQLRLSPFPRRLLKPCVLAAQVYEPIEFSFGPGGDSLSSQHYQLVIGLEVTDAEQMLHRLPEQLRKR